MRILKTVLGMAGILATVCAADTVTFQNNANGYLGCSNSYITMNTAANPGATDKLTVEGYHCAMCIDVRTLIRFDLSSVSTSANITSAKMCLWEYDQPRPGAGTVNVYAVSKAWDATQVTWYNAASNDAWSSAGTASGADYSASPAGTYSYTTTGQWDTVDITPAVQNIVANPDANFGFEFYMTPAMLTVRYTSANSVDIAHHPQLILDGTGLTTPVVAKTFASTAPTAIRASHDRLILDISAAQRYTVSIYSLRGQCLRSVTRSLAVGVNEISLSNMPRSRVMVSLDGAGIHETKEIVVGM